MTLAFRGVAPRLPAPLRGALESWVNLDGSFWRRLARWLVDDVPDKVMLTMTQDLRAHFEMA